MARMLLEGSGARPVGRLRAVTFEAQDAGRLQQVRVILRAVRVVTTEAGDAACVHETGDEIVALHAILVARSVGKMSEGSLAQLVLFQSSMGLLSRRPCEWHWMHTSFGWME